MTSKALQGCAKQLLLLCCPFVMSTIGARAGGTCAKHAPALLRTRTHRCGSWVVSRGRTACLEPVEGRQPRLPVELERDRCARDAAGALEQQRRLALVQLLRQVKVLHAPRPQTLHAGRADGCDQYSPRLLQIGVYPRCLRIRGRLWELHVPLCVVQHTAVATNV